LGRPAVLALYSGEERGLERYLETLKIMIQIPTLALGKQDVREPPDDDIKTVDRYLAKATVYQACMKSLLRFSFSIF
jgi:hypothetical protein